MWAPGDERFWWWTPSHFGWLAGCLALGFPASWSICYPATACWSYGILEAIFIGIMPPMQPHRASSATEFWLGGMSTLETVENVMVEFFPLIFGSHTWKGDMIFTICYITLLDFPYNLMSYPIYLYRWRLLAIIYCYKAISMLNQIMWPLFHPLVCLWRYPLLVSILTWALLFSMDWRSLKELWNMAPKELSRPNVCLKLISHPCALNARHVTIEPECMLVDERVESCPRNKLILPPTTSSCPSKLL